MLKPNMGGEWKDIQVVNSEERLLATYDQSGLKTMIPQQFIDWDDYVRCV